MAYLQPALVFKDEAIRINTLYWTSIYSYKKTVGILKLISDTGSKSPDPRVNQLWSSSEIGESSITSCRLSEFIGLLERNSLDIRLISILKICSAFENALSGYFYLCSLYEPTKDVPTYKGKVIPNLLNAEKDFSDRKEQIKSRCKETLHGKYKKRIDLICNVWGLPRITGKHTKRLNDYYAKRHLIAHDQSLDKADDPENSSSEIISSRISIDEVEWKQMLSDFSAVLEELDERVSSSIIKDKGLHLAIYRVIHRDGPQTLSELQGKLSKEWRMGNIKSVKTRGAAKEIGLTIKQVDGNSFIISK
ncbi:hypothetical protein [Azotobacter beijerinckii]|uniref:hypothetical protein n=1 Tax=Azotobacter beijerinckii TaxID=170623 RepID=UPI0029542783|nr:hypothetical protein [Azotobacter beijerinckii]MDV7213925.1 hypothetical protein [Azotobacter beijerinckii]